jgi:diguanylate cyclase (GGDEF)-like protein
MVATHHPRVSAALMVQDWDALLAAVAERLRRCASSTHATGDLADERAWLQAQVLDCVQALTLLQADLVIESERQVTLAAELGLAQAELAQCRLDLANTRAGERRALHRAHHDSLTLLPNREAFHQRLSEKLAQPTEPAQRPRLAVLYLDLDGLKPINDRHGHDAGDDLLRIVAARLARAVRKDDLVCRMGGDEFACLLNEVLNRDQLGHLACKLFHAVSAPLKIGALELTVRPSIGIAVCPKDGATADTLLRSADTAMYRAKRKQLGYAFFDAGHDAHAAI